MHANTTKLVVMELMVGPAPASSGTMLPFENEDGLSFLEGHRRLAMRLVILKMPRKEMTPWVMQAYSMFVDTVPAISSREGQLIKA
jgi:hypothetical protein